MNAPGTTDLCITSCYLPRDPRVVAFLNDFAAHLRLHDVELLVLSTAAEVPDLQAMQLQIPYELVGFDAQLDIDTHEPFHDADTAGQADAAWTGVWQPADTMARSVAKCEWFYRELAREADPCAALVWNTTLPHGRIAQNTLNAAGVPAYCFERGQLPASYQVQTYELNAWDDMACNFALRMGLADDVARQDDTAFEAVRAHYLAFDCDRYAPSGRLDRATLDACYGSTGKTVVVVFGSAAGSSLMPASVSSIRYSQPLWADGAEALEALDRALEGRDDVVVVFQDHPINVRFGLSPPLPSRFIRTHGVPIRDLLALADRVAVLGTSTVQYEALLLDKPVLLLGRSPLSLAGAAYGAVERGLDAAVGDWLALAGHDALRRNARGLIGLMCERHLIAQDASVPHFRRGAADLAKFVAGFRKTHPLSVEERLQRFVDRILPACRVESRA